jgi:VTC domain
MVILLMKDKSIPNVFTNRYEIKYLVETKRITDIRKAFGKLLVPDPYNIDEKGYYNFSIYLDSIKNRFYYEKHEGLETRVKPRIRSYRNTLSDESNNIYLEFKAKRDRIVHKQRDKISRTDALSLLSGKLTCMHDFNTLSNNKTLSRMYSMGKKYLIKPSVSVFYKRSAYYSPFYPNLRLTFDSGIKCSLSTRLDTHPNKFSYAIPPNLSMIELKYNGHLPKSILRKIEELELIQVTFSKYAVCLESCYEKISRKSVI